jgi:carboxyl-terminal processing protease
MLKPVISLLFSISLLSIRPANGSPLIIDGDTTQLVCREKASRLLDEVMEILQKNYYRKESVPWNELITGAKTRIAAASSCEETYDIISWCFRQLKENHTFLVPPDKAAVYNNDLSYLQTPPPLHQLVGPIRGELLENNIGYILVPWVSTTDSVICTQVADSLQHLIAAIDKQGVSRWIIDLRQNKGGNCWPMLAGIGPLLGNGTCGYFVSPEERIPISYRDGIAFHGRHPRCSVSGAAYQPKSGNKWIAVLTGPKTSSSGEIVALAFKEMKQVYLYGEPTAGYTTANATYTLSDRSMLVVTVCNEADRTGAIQYGRIIPHDLVYPDEKNTSEDVVKKKALMWLESINF